VAGGEALLRFGSVGDRIFSGDRDLETRLHRAAKPLELGLAGDRVIGMISMLGRSFGSGSTPFG
jgi:hypothetical protein